MRKAPKQAGITAVGFVLILVPVAFFIYVGMKMAPAYIEAFSVGDALGSLRKEAEIQERSPGDIYNLLRKRFDINNISSVQKEDVKILKTGKDVTVKVDYEARVPLVENIDLVMSFHKSTVLR